MEKAQAVEQLGQSQLLLPVWIKAALAANDRLKLYLTVLQAAQARAERPGAPIVNLSREFEAARVNEDWLQKLPELAFAAEGALQAEGLAQLCGALRDDLLVMARPLTTQGLHPDLAARVERWRATLADQASDRLTPLQVRALTSGRFTGDEASFHVLVMDLHKALNALAADLASETLDGAHVWQLEDADRPRVTAFMRGLNRTAKLKLVHPGLDAAATSDAGRLLLQNDIGTNDAHVLVIQVEGLKISLTYSDLHKRRFDFFAAMLEEYGAAWSKPDLRKSKTLNDGETYVVGVATFHCADKAALERALEGIGSRIVFLIDWNRARRKLNLFVAKDVSVAILTAAARKDAGHMGWLAAGGEQLLFGAMQGLGPDYFRIGDRVDVVMGESEAQSFLIDLLGLCSGAMLEGQSPKLIGERARALLGQRMRRRLDAFDHLSEHAAFCHALASALRDGLAHGCEADAEAAAHLSERAKLWERAADGLVNRARERSRRLPRASEFTDVIESADDVADYLEEAAFNLALIAEAKIAWSQETLSAVRALAAAVLDGVQDYVRALAIAQDAGTAGGERDQEEFLRAAWGVSDSEQRCDLLFRDVKRCVIRQAEHHIGASLSLDFASALEGASDALLRTGYRMREIVLSRLGAPQ